MSDQQLWIIAEKLGQLIQLQREQRVFAKYIYAACAQTTITLASLLGLSSEDQETMKAATNIVNKSRDLTQNLAAEIAKIQVDTIAQDPFWEQIRKET